MSCSTRLPALCLICKKELESSKNFLKIADIITLSFERRDAMFGQMDLILIGGVALLLFGPKKIPDLMKGLGKGLSEFKKAQSEFESEIKKVVDAPEIKNTNKE